MLEGQMMKLRALQLLMFILVMGWVFLHCGFAFAGCAPLAAARAQLSEAIPDAVVTELSGSALKVAGKIFNATPPESNAPVGSAAIIDLADGSGALAVGPSGMICAIVTFTPDRWKALRLTLLGRPT
jgi:hypothetical protein